MKYTYSIRHADAQDAPAIAQVQAGVWRKAYQGRVPNALIERMEDVAERTKAWQTIFESFEESGLGQSFVAVEDDSGVVGFGTCGPQRDDALLDQGFSGEISALYIAAEHQGAGLGSGLLRFMAADLLRTGHMSAAFWVLGGNPKADRFFTQTGGLACATRSGAHGDLHETAYGWRDLAQLAGRAS
ncbi:GNAT family N-acetyltransferase [Litorivita sp. NS0012-18]|uniref:GNAT family N-acetyltransferase n=1 Tax=Litorivita sp. NS0012-18 TaxID=3127655 RepID=UPI00333FA1E4